MNFGKLVAMMPQTSLMQQLLEIITDSTTASQRLHQLIQVQASAFQGAVDSIGELAAR